MHHLGLILHASSRDCLQLQMLPHRRIISSILITISINYRQFLCLVSGSFLHNVCADNHQIGTCIEAAVPSCRHFGHNDLCGLYLPSRCPGRLRQDLDNNSNDQGAALTCFQYWIYCRPAEALSGSADKILNKPTQLLKPFTNQ